MLRSCEEKENEKKEYEDEEEEERVGKEEKNLSWSQDKRTRRRYQQTVHSCNQESLINCIKKVFPAHHYPNIFLEKHCR